MGSDTPTPDYLDFAMFKNPVSLSYKNHLDNRKIKNFWEYPFAYFPFTTT
jgi:hypothetical protein